MHVVIPGAGVIGITTAHALLDEGHTVTVIEREAEPALGTSYANAGQISAALSAPWAVPGLVPKALKWLFERYPPLRFGRVPDAATLGWLWHMLRAANAPRYAASKRAMVRLGEYSRDRLEDLRTRLPLDYDSRTGGTLVLFRTPQQRDGYAADLAALADLGVPGRRLSLDELAALEPNLAIRAAGIIAAAHLPGDETGDCRRFTQALAGHLQGRPGFRLLTGTAVTGLAVAGGRVAAVETAAGRIAADAVVCCLGTATPALLAPLGIRVPVCPLKGYSLTIAADSDAVGPRSTVSDETHKVGVTCLGARIRVGGTAEIAGFDLTRPEKRYAGLFHVVRQLYPRIPAAALETAERWSGLRPMTPDGPPLIGPAPLRNLWLNTGHGTLGWTMAAGSAAIVADLIAGRPPAVDIAAFAPGRYG